MPDSLNAVIIIGLVMAPGYFTLWVSRQATKHSTPWSDSEFIVATVAVGVLIQALAFPFYGRKVLDDWSDKDLGDANRALIWIILTLVVMPLVFGIVIGAAINSNLPVLRYVGLDRLTRAPRAWNFALEREQGCFVRVYLTAPEDAVIVGRLSTKSMGSTDPDYQDLYIEQLWFGDKDDYPVKADTSSAGVWIAPASISRIEFIKGAGQ